MSLEYASYLSQVLATIALFASLIFVGIQIRQNTRSQKVVAVDSLAFAPAHMDTLDSLFDALPPGARAGD